MKINNLDVPNEMILRYCRVIKALEKDYSDVLESERGDLHDKIFNHVGCYKSLHRRVDRDFNTAFNEAILDITETFIS